MEVAKVFTDGDSQVVYLPEDCRFEQDGVFANRIGNIVILVPKDDPWASAFQGLQMFADDYLSEGIKNLNG